MLTADRELFYWRDRHAQIQKRAVSNACNADKRHQGPQTSLRQAKGAVTQHVLTFSDAGKESEEFTPIMPERDDENGRKVIHASATGVPVDAVCRFKCDKMTGAEAFVEQYRPDGQ